MDNYTFTQRLLDAQQLRYLLCVSEQKEFECVIFLVLDQS